MTVYLIKYRNFGNSYCNYDTYDNLPDTLRWDAIIAIYMVKLKVKKHIKQKIKEDLNYYLFGHL